MNQKTSTRSENGHNCTDLHTEFIISTARETALFYIIFFLDQCQHTMWFQGSAKAKRRKIPSKRRFSIKGCTFPQPWVNFWKYRLSLLLEMHRIRAPNQAAVWRLHVVTCICSLFSFANGLDTQTSQHISTETLRETNREISTKTLREANRETIKTTFLVYFQLNYFCLWRLFKRVISSTSVRKAPSTQRHLVHFGKQWSVIPVVL